MKNRLKPFYGTDLTCDRKNEACNGYEFLIAKPSAALSDSLEKSVQNGLKQIWRSELPIAELTVKWICGCLGFVIFVGIFRATADGSISFAQSYKNASFLYWAGGICLAVWLLLAVIGLKREKAVLENAENSYAFSEVDSIAGNIYAELNVPPDAMEVDILNLNYVIKKGAVKPRTKRFEGTAWCNVVMNAFTDSENLYLANMSGKFCFPLSSLRKIHSVKKRILLPEWTKDEEITDKKVELCIEHSGVVRVKKYYILELEHNGEAWGIYFPNYELSAIEALTGLTAEE